KKIGLAVAASIFVLPVINAAEQDAIIVTATRTAQIADESLSPVIVISREELEKETASEITDILHRYPGIDISRNGGPGQQSSIFIRGAESDHTLIMIDGIKINPGNIGTASIQNIPVEMIEQIEIVKGARSTLYGSDAIGGVINIITRKHDQKGSYYNASLGGGSFDTTTANFSAHNNTGDKSAGINITAKQSDGFSTLDSQTLERGYDNLSVNLYGKKRIGEMDAKFEYWQSEGNTEYFDYDFLFNIIPVDQDFKTSTTSISLDSNPSENWVSKIKLSHFDDKIEQNQSADFVRTRRNIIDWQNDIQISKSQLATAGLYFSDENTSSISYGSGYEVNTKEKAIFIQDNLNLNSHQIIAGARYTDHEVYSNHTTWNLEYGYQFNKQWKLIAAANTGFRSPSSTDRFGFGGNPNLKPEESKNTELAIRYQKGSHNFSINSFENNIDNLIAYTGTYPAGSNQNINKTSIKGIEVSYQYSANEWLIALSAIDQDPRNLSDDTLLFRRPEQKYNLSVSYNTDDYGIQMDITHVSERNDYGPVILDTYTLVGIKGNLRISKALSASARIENATDEEYQLADGYNTPERSYYLTLDYAF
ncbi:MAG: TonB-dependent receptor, partial [Gammaproteobacteria bacterium]